MVSPSPVRHHHRRAGQQAAEDNPEAGERTHAFSGDRGLIGSD